MQRNASPVCVLSQGQRERHRAYSQGLGLPMLAEGPAQKVIPLAIVGGGQSAAEYLPSILDFPGAVMALNGAYDWLADQGRVADYVLLLDGQATLAEYFRNPRKGTRFIVEGCCHPDVFRALDGFDVMLWASAQTEDEAASGAVPGGCSVMTRAPVVAAIHGFRTMTIFGADSCYGDGSSHVYRQADQFQRRMDELSDRATVMCNGRRYVTDPRLMMQAEYMAQCIPAMRSVLSIEIAGQHLLSDMIEAKGEWSLCDGA